MEESKTTRKLSVSSSVSSAERKGIVSFSKGKKRALQQVPDSSSESTRTTPELQKLPVKKPKRAETRPCPVCEEPIPLRLMGTHAELEYERVENIIRDIGSRQFIDSEHDEGSRRSAVKARKSLNSMNPRSDPSDTLELSSKTISNIKRRRKQRHAKLRELTKDEEEGASRRVRCNAGAEIACPVCLQNISGDQDVIDAHVDACLIYETNRRREQQEREEREREVDIDIENGVTESVMDEASFRGTDIHVRDQNSRDVDHDVDIDGDDEEVFGHVQFTEGDIIGPSSDPPADDPELGGGVNGNDDATPRESKTLKDLVAEGIAARLRPLLRNGEDDVRNKVYEAMDTGEVNLAIAAARKQGSGRALIAALENKVKLLESTRIPPLLCRICLDPYTEPTVSTGCWHTCCRECWLRCLGSTKLCPICKRITVARELRRIYL